MKLLRNIVDKAAENFILKNTNVANESSLSLATLKNKRKGIENEEIRTFRKNLKNKIN